MQAQALILSASLAALPPAVVSVASRTWLLNRGRDAWRSLFREPELRGLSGGARVTLRAIGEHWGTRAGDDWAWPSEETIGELVGKCSRTVRRHLAELTVRGLLERLCKRDGRGWQHNFYRPAPRLHVALERLALADGPEGDGGGEPDGSPESGAGPKDKEASGHRTKRPRKASIGEDRSTSSCAPSARERSAALAAGGSECEPVASEPVALAPEPPGDLEPDPEIPIFYEDESTPFGDVPREPQGVIGASSVPRPAGRPVVDVARDSLALAWSAAYPGRKGPSSWDGTRELAAAMARVRECEGKVADVLRDVRDAIAGALDRSSGPPSPLFIFGSADHFARNVYRGRDLRLKRARLERVLALRPSPVPAEVQPTSAETIAGAAAALAALELLCPASQLPLRDTSS